MDPGVLAGLAGNALVAAVVTDGWQGLRHKVASWFGRGQPDAAAERWLVRTEELVAAAAPGELGHVQERLAAQWEGRFADVIEADPDATGELEVLVRDLRVVASAATVADHSAAAGGDMTARADRGSNAANVVHGSMIAGPTRPGPASR